jgi:sugar fermentation stimulation protein A
MDQPFFAPADRLALARDIDREHGEAFDRAMDAGVEAIAWECEVTVARIVLRRAVPVVG